MRMAPGNRACEARVYARGASVGGGTRVPVVAGRLRRCAPIGKSAMLIPAGHRVVAGNPQALKSPDATQAERPQ